MKPSTCAVVDHAGLSGAQRAACRAASFTIRTPRLLRLHAGVRNPELARLLKTHQALTAAVVTAYNPAGRKLPASQNKMRHAALAAALKKLKLVCLPAERQADDHGDAPEAAYFVLDISGAQAEALLAQFDQHALLWCNQSSPPELMLHPAVRQRGS